MDSWCLDNISMPYFLINKYSFSVKTTGSAILSGLFVGYTIKALALIRCQNFVHSPCTHHKYNCDVTVSCDNPVAFPSFIAGIVVAVIAMYGGHRLAWLPKVCNYQLSLGDGEQLIMQVWCQ